MKKTPLIFLHIPKTAGSTLGHPLHRQYPPEAIFAVNGNFPEKSVQEFIALPQAQRDQYQCISGHVPFGLHAYMSGAVSYVTILRDPVKRIISLYYHILREPTHYLYQSVAVANMTLLDFASSTLSREISNDQTRMISGVAEWNQKTDQSIVDQSVFQRALSNIEQFFPVVGLTERFEESLLLMQAAYAWGNVFYSSHKVAGKRATKEPIAAAVEIIRAQNQYDLLLYDYARARLQKQIAVQGAGFPWRIRGFNLVNDLYNRIRAYRQIPLFSRFWNFAVKRALRQS